MVIEARKDDADSRVGHWSCNLLTEALSWTDGVYDLFDLPRGTPLDRATTVRFYTPQSRIDMECARTAAVLEKGSFSVDAEITTALGKRRWIRIEGSVACENGVGVRLFGTKRDVTAIHADGPTRVASVE